MEDKKVILSGIRATGQLHLGNYIGALRFFVELAKNPGNKCFYFIANLHTLTTHTDPELLKKSLHGIVLDFLSAGLNPETATIYAQSSIPEITELTWLLSCLTPVNNLMTMPHYKEKGANLGKAESPNAGLLTYPVLMAADILAVKANLVPVGQDQHPHVEMTRELARRFNLRYGQLFPLPDLLEGEGIRLPGLTGHGKMGKSEEGRGVVYLTDSPQIVKGKIRKAATDPQRRTRKDPGDPQICNIFTFHTLFSAPEEIGQLSEGCRTAKIGCIACKDILIGHINEVLGVMRIRRQELEGKGKWFVDEIIHQGGIRAREVIQQTVQEAKELVGVPSY